MQGTGALEDGMTQRDIYLMNAAYLFAKAEAEKDSAIRADFENMARAYLRLVDQAVRNAQNDIVYETPPPGRDRDRL
jgi:hypothetical protein